VRAFLAAVSFLTRVPVGIVGQFDHVDVGRAAAFFPWVGALIGAAQACVIMLGALIGFSPVMQGVCAVSVMVLLTGALHQDALADMADGFAGARTKPDVLRVMRDPAVGSFGAVTLILAFALRIGALTLLIEHGWATKWLIAATALSRWAPVKLAWWLPYAHDGGGLGQAMTNHVRLPQLIGASMSAVVLAGLSLGRYAGLSVLAVVATCTFVGSWSRSKIGGVTGDVLGGATEACEILVLVLGAALAGWT